ncbi:MAG: NADH-quinone oxidoreductase subunit N [Cephaloticoccus sp.]|nr:NADH-quinone oxidoreductase subunit N [Cephaloticoccus sp.]MCF7759687.1 NADH-quinone oxidoreductase subunit N [Cephaloticoccus sp.]
MSPDYNGLFHALLPETALVLGALIVLGFDLITGRRRSREERLRAAAMLGGFAVVVAAAETVAAGLMGPVFGGVLMLDTLGLFTRMGVLLLALLAISLAPGTVKFRHPAEFVAVLLFATAGFTLMAVAQQLLLVFLAVELASLSLYILAGFDKQKPDSAEAALKYFLFGGMAAAFMLFGFSLLYGLSGSIELPQIAAALAAGSGGPLLQVALVMVLVAFGFKAAAAPFHLWAPDVYQGAPPAATALIASASKFAGVTIFVRLLWPGLGSLAGHYDASLQGAGWLTAVALIALASLLVGNLAALAQSNVRRLLAYSAIAHAGVMLIGVMVTGVAGVGPLMYYVMTYGLATIGAFGVIGILDQSGGCQKITDLAGLHRRSPLLAGVLLVYLLSLAGVPPLAGFFGKFAVFAEALAIGGATTPVGVLALLAIALSAVALYYYLQVLKQALVKAPAPAAPRIPVSLDLAVPLVMAAGLLLGLGLWPSVILNLF